VTKQVTKQTKMSRKAAGGELSKAAETWLSVIGGTGRIYC